jgi:hypothetical protein
MQRYLFIIMACFLAAPLLAGDGDAPRKIAQAKPRPPIKAVEVTDKVEADVLEFVKEHHPELAELLSQLKDRRPKEYQKALRDLSRVRERLFAMQKNDNGRYELELSVWKAQTKIQLLAARLQMDDTPEMREQLRAALNEQADMRIELLKHERSVVQDRLGKIDEQIKRLDQERSAAIEKQMQVLTKAPAEKKSPEKKPVEKKPVEKKPR